MARHPYIEPAPGVYKPWIEVRLKYVHKITPAPIVALVDSGADVCLCAKHIGEWLGIKFRNQPTLEITAVNSSSLTAYKQPITLYVCGKQYSCPFYFAENLPPETPIILGQAGFFDHFKIVFDLQSKSIEII